MPFKPGLESPDSTNAQISSSKPLNAAAALVDQCPALTAGISDGGAPPPPQPQIQWNMSLRFPPVPSVPAPPASAPPTAAPPRRGIVRVVDPPPPAAPPAPRRITSRPRR